ncbi:hypothetical protein D9619_007582 [Psilocybe cf. subviscida]|uniref:F-box domain-containing protein n=1 Tax=Psilocybe cf. subviscida TaxID=2480587 RepID=A0A8H5B233_9AGAR|nr:hypothetical protein D9619_007582 [Psilocybe cf. subviscida]
MACRLGPRPHGSLVLRTRTLIITIAYAQTHPTMSSPQPPLEIYLYIIRKVTCNTTLCALSLCCRKFRDDAQRTLFYNPRVLASYTPARHEAFIDAITSSPDRLAPMVHVYVFDSFPTVSRKLINAALRAMSNLKQLGILARDQIYAEDVAHWTFKLDVLSWGEHQHRLLDCPSVLSAILQNQPNLKHLRAFGDTTVPQLKMDPHWCPQLQGVAGHASFVNLVLSHARPICHVQWINHHGCQFVVPPVNRLTLSGPPSALGSVRYFCFKRHNDTMDQAFLRHMRSLILVDAYVVCASDKAMADRLDFLANVPGIHRLILTGSILMHRPHPNAIPYIISARRAFRLCSNLRYIDVRHDRSRRVFYRIFPPSTTSDKREVEVTMVGEDEVYAWQAMDFNLVNEEFPQSPDWT